MSSSVWKSSTRCFPTKTAEWVPLNILWIIPQTIDSGDSELEGENNIL